MNNTILQALREDANNLIRAAQVNNAVVTITLEPQQPLAMGNHAMVADVRPERQRSATGFDLDAMCKAAMTRLSAEISANANAHKRYLACSYFEAKRSIETRHDRYSRNHYRSISAFHNSLRYPLIAVTSLTDSMKQLADAMVVLREASAAASVNRILWPVNPNRDGSRNPFPIE